LPKKKVLVVGLGEVGRPLLDLVKESGEFDVYGFDSDKAKMRILKQGPLPENFDVMHSVCLVVTKRSLSRS
jgi:UDP-N-acetyl-D-mannosaminuronate dehydrogenase